MFFIPTGLIVSDFRLLNFIAPVFEVRGLGLEGHTQMNRLGAEQPKTAWKQREFLDNPRPRIQFC